MSPLPISNGFVKRDTSTLSTGDIAGIIVGIVVVALILLGLFIWRLLSYRNNFGPYTARSRDSSAKEKALAQARAGEHVRSTRPRDADASAFDEKTGLVAAKSRQFDEEGALESDRPSPIQEDDRSLHGTVGEEYDEIAIAKGKQAQRQSDYEMYQGHHAGPAPAFNNNLSVNESGAPDAFTDQEGAKAKKGSVRQGCTTM